MPPIAVRSIYSRYKNTLRNFDSLWKPFQIFELTKVMRQQRDLQFIALLNNVYITDVNSSDIELLESKVIHSNHINYAHGVLHMYGANSIQRRHNLACF